MRGGDRCDEELGSIATTNFQAQRADDLYYFTKATGRTYVLGPEFAIDSK